MSGYFDNDINLMEYAIDSLYTENDIEVYESFFGADWKEKYEFMDFDDTEEIASFKTMMSMHYGRDDMPWLQDLYLLEEEPENYDNIFLNNNSIKLADCSKKIFKEIVNIFKPLK